MEHENQTPVNPVTLAKDVETRAPLTDSVNSDPSAYMENDTTATTSTTITTAAPAAPPAAAPTTADEDEHDDGVVNTTTLPPDLRSTSAAVRIARNKQVSYVTELRAKKPTPGETWYAVPIEWYRRWELFCTSTSNDDAQSPGPVSTNSITKPDGFLLPNLEDKLDIIFVPEKAWKLFETSYGVLGESIPRKIFYDNTFESLYPININVYVVNSDDHDATTADGPQNVLTILISDAALPIDLIRDIKEALLLPPDANLRLWKLEANPDDKTRLHIDHSLLKDAELVNDEDATTKTIAELDLELYGCAVEMLTHTSNINDYNSIDDNSDQKMDYDQPLLRAAPPREKQYDRIKKLEINQHLVPGETWYIMPCAWIKRWKEYCMATDDDQATNPGPVDMRSIMGYDGSLLENLYIGSNVQYVPEEMWKTFHAWYGSNAEPCSRVVLPDGEFEGLYPSEVRVYVVRSPSAEFSLSNVVCVELNDSATAKDLRKAIEEHLAFPPDVRYQLWKLKDDPEDEEDPYIDESLLAEGTRISDDDPRGLTELELDYTPCAIKLIMDDDDQDLETANLHSLTSAPSSPGPMMMISPDANESEMAYKEPPPSYSSLDRTINFAGPSSDDEKELEPEFERGLCGLVNMGNTCYMNSALQCLSNTAALTGYFLEEMYKKEINRDNPLGMNGELAEAYGDLIKDMWSGRHASIAPRNFKYTISRFNSTFLGYRQHDSQELLSFLLDGLHEDLNRIVKKPYVELPDFDDMPDGEVAMRCWEYHKARNDSVIVDLFQGQFKSRLVCQECGKISIMFDPFMYLSLPLPVQKKTQVKIIYVPYDPIQRQRRMKLTFQSNASIEQLQEQVAQRAGVSDPTTLLVAEIYDRAIFKVYPSYEPISGIAPNDIIYVYQLPISVPTGQPVRKKRAKRADGSSSNSSSDEANDEAEWVVFPVYCASTPGSPNTSSTRPPLTQFGGPIVLAIRADEASSAANVYRLIAEHIERFTMLKLFEEVKDAPRDEAMEIDPPQQGQKSIHTSAAVTAAGGRLMKPIKNLFTMKLFWESAYRGISTSTDILPTTSPLSSAGLVDLTDRGSDGSDPTPSTTSGFIGPPLPTQQDEESDPLPFYASDNDDDDDSRMTTISVTPREDADMDDPMATDANMSRQGKASDDEDNLNDSSNKGQSPALSTATTDGKKSSTSATPPASNLPSPTSWTTASSPRPLIKQGEGIVLVWPLRKAQEMFGGIDGVDTRGWEDIDKDDHADDAMDGEDDNNDKLITLAHCLNEFTREEMLGDQDLWYCPRCKKHQRAQKKIDLWCLPEIMVIHLKRFSSTRMLRDKIDILIDFPVQELDMTDWVTSSPADRERQLGDHPDDDRIIYDLYAVDNHFGGMGGGHYTAFAQNPETGKWCKFNDSHVSPVHDVSSVKTEAAYLLFYKRRRTTTSSSNSCQPEEWKE